MENIFNYKKNAADDYYEILGCDETSTMEQILCEFKARSLDCHPDKNIDDPSAVCKFQELVRAKEVLADPESRSMYDKWRKSGICIPFTEFQNLSKCTHTSIHWACKKNKDLMIEGHNEKEFASCDTSKVLAAKVVWEREEGNNLLQRFRNYDI